MRILCLHDNDSSGSLLLHQLNSFAKKLHDCHGIELAFVDSPLVSSTSTSIHGNPQKTWFHENSIGLDASILSLSQIWKQSLHSNPFCGVIGIGQGASIAALLPLLQTENHLEEDQGGGFMFEGIEFCIFFNGYDILNVDKTDTTRENEEESFYHEVRDLPSLHIITKSASNEESTPSLNLYERYGGGQNSSVAQIHYVDNDSFHVSIFNLIGKFLVKQKKAKKMERRIQIQEKENTVIDIAAAIERTRAELSFVQEEAQSLMASVVAENPPKALMAVITPDPSRNGTLVGGWDGDKDAFRSEGFKTSGGAPCPKEFTLKQKERIKEDTKS